MKVRTLALCLFFLAAIPLPVEAQECQMVTSWGENDALYFNVSPANVTAYDINNTYNAGTPSSYTAFYMVTQHPALQWQFAVDVRSYNDPTYAARQYSTVRNAVANNICHEVQGSYFTTAYMYSCNYAVGSFTLVATYRERFYIKLEVSNNRQPQPRTSSTASAGRIGRPSSPCCPCSRRRCPSR
jgi:hypothetical protein